MTKQLISIGFVVTGLVLSLVPKAYGQLTYKSNTVYRAGTSEIIISGTPNTKVSLTEGNYTKTTSKTANTCGLVKIKIPKLGLSNLNVNGSSIDASTLATGTVPRCSKGTLTTPLSGPLKTAAGTIVVPGLTPNTSISVSYDTPKVKNVSINACGFGAIKTTNSSPTLPATFTIAGTNYTTSALTDAGQPPKFQRVNGTPTCYTPVGWTN